MAIDVDSPTGRKFKELATALYGRRQRFDRLYAYYTGEPPLPEGMGNLREVASDFFRTSRTTFAEVIVEALRERLQPAGIRTGVDDDESGDEVAWTLWNKAKLAVSASDVHQWMCVFGESYAIVSWSERKQRPIVTAEDPRQVITRHDPLTDDVIDGLKLFRDDVEQLEVAYVYIPGGVRVATRSTKRMDGVVAPHDTIFKPGDWTWDDERSADLPAGFEDVVPVVRFLNRDGVGEFERHTDVLDRINRSLLRGLVIMTFQAFKQRAVQGDLPEFDEAGNPINYSELLKAGPDALWLLPPDAKIWESGQVDLNPILSFAKNDVLFLAATTRTPMTMFTPDAATQTAEGASLQREGLVFKAKDRIRRVNDPWSEVASLMLRFAGETERADIDRINLLWAPVELFSVAERASAMAMTKGIISRRQALIEIWGMSPDQAERNLSELVDDQLLDAQFAAATQPAAQPAADPNAAPTVAQQPAVNGQEVPANGGREAR